MTSEEDRGVNWEEEEQEEKFDENSSDQNNNALVAEVKAVVDIEPKMAGRPYMAIGILTKGNCKGKGGMASICTNKQKHKLDPKTSQQRIPQHKYKSRMRPTVNYGQSPSILGWYGRDDFERHVDAGRYEMPWRSIMLKDGDHYGPRRLIRENAKLAKLPNFEHDTCIYWNRSIPVKYNVESQKSLNAKIRYPGYPEVSKLIFPPIYANKSKYQISQRKAMGRILNRQQYPEIFHKKGLLECLPDCPDLPANQRPA